MALAASPKQSMPRIGDLLSEALERSNVRRHGVVVEVAACHSTEPATLLRDGLMPATREGSFHRAQRCPHPRLDGVSRQEKVSSPGLRADVREAEEVEGLRLPVTTLSSISGSEATKFEHACLFRMQFQREATQSLAKLLQKLRGFNLVLEPNQKVVSEAHDDDVAVGLTLSPLLGPEGRGRRDGRRSRLAARSSLPAAAPATTQDAVVTTPPAGRLVRRRTPTPRRVSTCSSEAGSTSKPTSISSYLATASPRLLALNAPGSSPPPRTTSRSAFSTASDQDARIRLPTSAGKGR